MTFFEEGWDIAYVLRRYPVLSETFVSSEVRGLKAAGENIVVLSIINDKNVQKETLADPFVYRLKFNRLKDLLKICIRILRHPSWGICALAFISKVFLKSPQNGLRLFTVCPVLISFAHDANKNGVRHLHSHFSTLATLSSQLVAKLLKCSFSFTFHTLPELKGPTFQDSINSANAIVVNSITNKNALINLYGEVFKNKTRLIRSGLDLDKWVQEREAVNIDKHEIISVCRLIPKKGIDILIQALSLLQKKRIKVKCKIIGDGPEKENLIEMARAYNLENSIQFLGSRSHNEIEKLLKNASLFVMPCRHTSEGEDGLPVAITEAMAVGLPVISCSVGGISEVVRNGITGVLIPENDCYALAYKIEHMMKNTSLRKKIGKNAQAYIIDEFDIKKNISNLHSLFSSQF